ncbi:zinc finger MYND domain-containing protein 10-like [Uloborus diversus]|uniref:zinc finger MYND domain-containing protein 10-like n=1 Tax=Uloborus diversus TaxID=327109 RepID=UPI00240908E8|nr:zinc finger MYND domain-containing protein 10-like [Uloborus diversus]
MDDSKVLYANEIELYFDTLEIFDVSDIGSSRWLQQHERIYQLSLQALLDAKSGGEELVKELVIMHQKIPQLVLDLITTEMWRLKILPLFLKWKFRPKSTIPLYMVLYHEVTLVSFFEAVLFHEDVMESASDVLIDLTDFCYRNILPLTSPKSEAEVEEDVGDEMKQLLEQKKEIEFELGVKCISILSYMTQHLKIISLSVLHRLLAVHDVPLLFTNLICDPPWIREVNDGEEKYCDGKWNKLSKKASVKLNKIEGQIWMALIQFLMHPECQKKYEVTDFRKDQLLRLRSKLSGFVTDQMPILNELVRFLEHLNIFDAPTPKSDLIIEQIPEIWESMHSKNHNWKQISKFQMENYFLLSEEELKNFCKRLCRTFDLKNIEAMLPDAPSCAACGGRGLKRCSRCKNEWYCGRACQVSHWEKHRNLCDLTATTSSTS